MLSELSSAPPIPHQRHKILNIYLFLKLTHKLILGNVHRNTLKRIDVMVRTEVKRRLRLLKDCPLGSMQRRRMGAWAYRIPAQKSHFCKEQYYKSFFHTKSPSTEMWWTWNCSKQLLNQSAYPVMWEWKSSHWCLRKNKHGPNSWGLLLMVRSSLWRRWTKPATSECTRIQLSKQESPEGPPEQNKTQNAEDSAMHRKHRTIYYNSVK